MLERFEFVSGYFLFCEEGDFFPAEEVVFAADHLETGLQVVELDAELFVLVGHASNLCVHYFVFLGQLVQFVREAFVLGPALLQLPTKHRTFSISDPTYFSWSDTRSFSAPTPILPMILGSVVYLR